MNINCSFYLEYNYQIRCVNSMFKWWARVKVDWRDHTETIRSSFKALPVEVTFTCHIPHVDTFTNSNPQSDTINQPQNVVKVFRPINRRFAYTQAFSFGTALGKCSLFSTFNIQSECQRRILHVTEINSQATHDVRRVGCYYLLFEIGTIR